MLMPGIFGEDFVDEFFGTPSKNSGSYRNQSLMQTDIKENESCFVLEISLPGFEKEQISAELKDGYLTIKATTKESGAKDTSFRYIRKERYIGSCSRTFYVGEVVTKDDIKAKYENGILSLTVPKLEKKPETEEQHYISIEG